MRWYCVHPSLPAQAELRIRSAPDGRAPERARVSQGRAVAACAPLFLAPGTDAETPVPWLQVATWESEDGFMMAALPDGLPLVTPWEETNVRSCADLRSEGAALFDGPQEAAQSVGELQAAGFPLCVLEESGARARIWHAELESVWVDKSELRTICAKLSHAGCSTAHAFYKLNEALPEEAQIAIREFPSKEAQTIGLLSRGETLEATVRGGNWLRLARAEDQEEAWIMWRTDALELLTEIPDQRCRSCEKAAETADTSAANAGQNVDEMAPEGISLSEAQNTNVKAEEDEAEPEEPSIVNDEVGLEQIEPETVKHSSVADEANCDGVDRGGNEEIQTVEAPPSWDDRALDVAPAPSNAAEEAKGEVIVSENESGVAMDSIQGDEGVHIAANQVEDSGYVGVDKGDEGTGEMEHPHVTPSWEDRPIRPVSAASDDAEDNVIDGPTVNDIANALDPTTQSPSCDDRPIRPAPTVSEAADDDLDAACLENFESEELQETTVASWDDRPIRPAPTEPEYEDNDVAEAPIDDDSNGVESLDNRLICPAPIVSDNVDDERVDASAFDDAATNVEPVPVALSWDDRTIRPVSTVLEDVVDASTSDDTVADEPVPAVTKVSEDIVDTPENVAVDVEPVLAASKWDDRPIRFVKTELGDDVDAVIAEKVAIGLEPMHVEPSRDDRPVPVVQVKVVDIAGNAPSLHNAENSAEPIRATLSTDDLPIRPTPVVLSDNSDSEVDVPMLGESAPSWEDDCLIQPLNDAADYAAELPMLGDGAKSTQASPSWDDRSIQPVKDLDDSFSLDKCHGQDEIGAPDEPKKLLNALERSLASPVENEDVLNADAENTSSSNAWDDVPVGPRQRVKQDYSSAWEDTPVDSTDGGRESREPFPASSNHSEDKRGDSMDVFEAVMEDAIEETGNLSPDDVADDISDPADIAEKKTQNEDTNDADGALYLQKFGIGKYCEHKQALIAPSDDLSQAIYEASQDDSDLVFQALVGDDPLSDDWFHVVASRDLQTEPQEDSKGLVDVLYNRSQSSTPSASSPMPSQSTPGPTTTYDLIMGDAMPEEILEAELSADDDGNFDLIGSFKYPVPKRRAIDTSGGRASSFFKRVPSAPTGMSLQDAEDSDPRDARASVIRTGLGAQTPSPPKQRMSVRAKTSPVSANSQAKRASGSGQGVTAEPSVTRHPSPLRHRMSESAITPQIPKKSMTPPKSSTPTQPVGTTAIAAPATSRLTQRRSIATPGGIRKPPTSFMRPRSLTAATSAPVPVKPRTSSFARPSTSSAVSPTRTVSDPSPPKPTRSLLQRRSFLPTPSPSKALGTPTTRISIASSIPKPPEASGLPAPRKSFGFRRPSALTKN